MNFIDEKLTEYMISHSSAEPELLADLRRETWQKVLYPRMLSGEQVGRFLSLMSAIIKPEKVLEIGTYTGYATLCLAGGLAPGGVVHTIDNNEELTAIQEKYFSKSKYNKRIIRHLGDAMKVIPDIDGHFDLIFLDADKRRYPEYYRLIKTKIFPGSILIADNVLWSGKVLDINDTEPDTAGIREFNRIVREDPDVESVMIPLRDGISLIRFH